MAKVKFWCDSGANIHSCRRSGVFDTVDDLGLEEGQWEEMTEEERYKEVEEWAWQRLDIGYTEVEG